MKLAFDLYTPMNAVAENFTSAPVILVHSIIENKKTWMYIGPILARNTQRRVYAIDLRNHGNSPWTDEYNIEAMTEDLNEFLVTHRISKIVLVGHSLGGKVAIAFALKEPTKIEKLIVEDARVQMIRMGDETMVSQLMTHAKTTYKTLIMESTEKEAMGHVYSLIKNLCPLFSMPEDFADVYPWERYPLKWTGKSLEVELNLESVLDAIAKGALQPKAFEGKFEGDALFIIGEHSQFRVQKDKDVDKHFPGASKVIIDTGHFIHQGYPDQFLNIVTDFINKGRVQRSKY